MSSNKIIIGIIAATLLIIVGGIALVSRSGPQQLTVSESVHLEVQETSYDWGEIPINNGNVNKTFEIKNNSQGVLELANVSTSCMCTTAQVIINDQKSPFFGMHPNSSWLGKVAAGESAQVFIEFDPAFHGPSGIGQASRQVSLDTNDPDNPKITFNLIGNVIK